MDATAWSADRASGLRALRDLRAARRRRYAEQVDWMESLYRVYLAVIFGGWGLALISTISSPVERIATLGRRYTCN